MTISYNKTIKSTRKDRTLLWKEASLPKKLYHCKLNMKNY